MLRKIQIILSVGLSGMLALSFDIVNAADTPSTRAPNVLHEMVPHVVLPETIQYNKTAKNMPGTGYSGVNSPFVATYVAFPSYQVPHSTEFKPIGQSVYPVSPPLLPAPLPPALPWELNLNTMEELAWHETDSEDIVLTAKITEPIRLASNSEETVPTLPMPVGAVAQTSGIFCQHPEKPPSAWAFSSPIFKVASVPAGWSGQAGGIVHGSPKGSIQHVGFQPIGNVDPASGVTVPQMVPYSTFQLGHGVGQQDTTPQVQVLPNGMVLLTLPANHANCGMLRCRTGCAPRNVLLPPAGFIPQAPQGMMPGIMGHGIMPQSTAMFGNCGTPFMQVSHSSPMLPTPMSPIMPPQMQIVPVTTMTPMGPAIVGYQQIPAMNPTAMMPQMVNPTAMMPQMVNPTAMMDPQMQQMQMAYAAINPTVASQMVAGVAAETSTDAQQAPVTAGSADGAAGSIAVVATPFGYALQVPVDALQAEAAAQLAQIQQSLVQSQMPMQMPENNPYAGLYATPFGYMAMNQSAGQFGYEQQMMNVGYAPGMPGMPMYGQGGMSVSDILQILAFINSNKPQQHRMRLADRIAERRENRKETVASNDPFTQLMQAWSTPFVSPDTTLRMPSRNAYPYGYFGAQALPVSTANYGGYHNLYYGNSSYPGLY